jgi:Legionella pneumophila major outer membrane protein precursor
MRRVAEPGRVARKGALQASASLIVLAIASSDLRAQSAQSTQPSPPPAGAPQGQWSSWSDAGLTGHPATDPAIGLPPLGPFANIDPGIGWEGAIGFDHRLAGCEAATAPLLVEVGHTPCWLSPYHISGQFRYGQNIGGSDPVSRTNVSMSLLTTSGTATPAIVDATGSGTLNNESHWLVDLGVGRDFGLGSSNVQAILGVRVAEISSTASGTGNLQACLSGPPPGMFCTTPATGGFSFQSRSQFLGVGPRLGVDGTQPLAGSWGVEYLGGVAVLFGNRSLTATQTVSATTTTIVPPSTLTSMTALNPSSTVGVFNLDAQAGISYWLTPNFKLTVSYRFDGYFNALTIVEPNGAPGQQDRFYYGPMLRGTVAF